MTDRLTDALFDPFHYASVSGARGDDAALRRHFDAWGRKAGLSPGPLFDARWYLAANADVLDAGVTAYDHYHRWGRREGRSPNPLFDPAWYRKHRMRPFDRRDPFDHYLRIGRNENRAPGPHFWPDWYRETAMKGEGGDPVLHYLSTGWRRGLAPNPLFDPEHYQTAFMGATGGEMDPLAHLVLGLPGDPARSTHPLFDGRHYLDGLARMGTNPQVPAIEHYLSAESDRGLPDPHPLFDADYYRAGRGKTCRPLALIDYLLQGPAALVDPHPLFSKRHYYRHAPDVQHEGVDPLTHYVRCGDAEGRSFHPLFDAAHYRSQGPFQGTTLGDYVARGLDGRRAIRAPAEPDRSLQEPSPQRRVSKLSPTEPLTTEDRIPATVGIFAHIFHDDCAEEIFEAANNAPAGATRVFVSTDTPEKAHRIKAVAATISEHPVEIRVFPNRGRDIAPFIVGFADRLREVEVGCHVHSKRSLHYRGGNCGWRRYLLAATLGTPVLVRNILHLLGRDRIGAVVPDHYPGISEVIEWGGNFDLASALFSMMGQRLDRDGSLDLPAGSMFWFRTAALEPLLDLRLSWLHFDPEAGQIDGTLAHAIERLFLPVVEAAGFSYVTHRAPEAAETADDAGTTAARANRLRPLRADLGLADTYFHHTCGYLARPSAVERPRLNLLIPTADRGRAYAGVTAALEVFEAVRSELGSWDSRIISTDLPCEPGGSAPEGYDMAPIDARDTPDSHILVDGTARRARPMPLRRRDIFVATAWWTATQAEALRAWQKSLHGLPPPRHVYLIQDHENGFQPWSTEWALADATYADPTAVIPVFNTPILADHFRSTGQFSGGHALRPAMNQAFAGAIRHRAPKERLVLLYARPHAARNCLEFLDMVARQCRSAAPDFWSDWRFLAIGEDFAPNRLAIDSPVEVLGRLSVPDYAALASRAALALSLMVSPHPSYPPLEMAAAGVRVLTNRHGDRDSAELHDNIASFRRFDPADVAGQLGALARAWQADPASGWSAEPRIDWFYGGRTNIRDIASAVAADLLQDLSRCPEGTEATAPVGFLKAS